MQDCEKYYNQQFTTCYTQCTHEYGTKITGSKDNPVIWLPTNNKAYCKQQAQLFYNQCEQNKASNQQKDTNYTLIGS
jgi:hypothetical protein